MFTNNTTEYPKLLRPLLYKLNYDLHGLLLLFILVVEARTLLNKTPNPHHKSRLNLVKYKCSDAILY